MKFVFLLALLICCITFSLSDDALELEDLIGPSMHTVKSLPDTQLTTNESKAIAYFNALQILHNFTVGWTIIQENVLEQRPKQLKLLTGPDGDFKEGKIKNDFTTGTTKAVLQEVIQVFQISPAFKGLLGNATEHCEYFVDDEFRLDDKTIIIFRHGFVKQGSHIDKYTTVRSEYHITLTKIDTQMQTFLQCVSGHGSRVSSSCELPHELSFYEWVGFKIWFRALTRSSFIEENKMKHELLEQNMQKLNPYLPEDYYGAEACLLWPKYKHGCSAVENVVFTIGLDLVLNWNNSKLSENEHQEALASLKADHGAKKPAEVVCLLSHDQLYEKIVEWQRGNHIEEDFAESLRSTITGRATTHDYAFVRDIFYGTGLFTLNYARVLVVYDFHENQFHVSSVFWKTDVLKLSNTLPINKCSIQDDVCQYSKIEYTAGDQSIRRRIIVMAVDAIKKLKE